MRFQLTLLACVAFAQGALAQGNSERTVKVSVNNGVIAVSPDPANMSKGHNKIVWSLATAGYTFANDGIVIEGNGKEYGDCGKQGSSTTVYVCKKLVHVNLKQYKYDVNLVNASGQRVSLDPRIIND
jgi:hypothetical protein